MRSPLKIICGLDLRRLGQSTRIARSTIEQVRARIAMLREKTKEASKAKAFDFDARLEEVRRKEEEAREAKRAEKKAARDARLIDAVKDPESDAITQMMGFGGFGTTKKT
jgi:U4/U6.U5 tri-snRNP component SNU23